MSRTRAAAATALVLCLASWLKASDEIDLTPLEDHPCGNRFKVSSAYTGFDARVEKVMDCSTLLVTLYGYPHVDVNPPPITREVLLAGIDAHSDDPELCTSFLIERISGTRVELLANGSRSVDDRILPVIVAVNGHLNRHLLSNGLARFATEVPYELNHWDACDYRRAEEFAKNARIGVWSADDGE